MIAPMNDPAVHVDAFNLLCDDFIATGTYRSVYTCRLNPAWVVKVELDKGDWRSFANVLEHELWTKNQYCERVARWLAPCRFLSTDGRILIQDKATIAKDHQIDELPKELPAFLTDLKPSNFGWIDGKFVCVDYSMHIDNISTKLKKVNWRE